MQCEKQHATNCNQIITVLIYPPEARSITFFFHACGNFQVLTLSEIGQYITLGGTTPINVTTHKFHGWQSLTNEATLHAHTRSHYMKATYQPITDIASC